jgi:hypothetical protein
VMQPSAAVDTDPAMGVSAGELAALKAEQTRLATELAELRGLVQRLARELGVEGP